MTGRITVGLIFTGHHNSSIALILSQSSSVAIRLTTIVAVYNYLHEYSSFNFEIIVQNSDLLQCQCDGTTESGDIFSCHAT